MTDPLDPAAELAELARAVWRADHDDADVPDDQVPGFEALARALDKPYMEDARVDAVARLDELYRERTGREPEDVANDPGWRAVYRASIDAVYRDGFDCEPPDDPDERAEAMGDIYIAGRILALASTALRCADPPVSQHGHPLAPLVRSWHRRPISADPVRRVDRILPGSVAMIDSRDRRSGRLFSPATHRRGQQVLPGLGNETPDRGGGHGAPLALRLFVEAVLCVPMDRRDGLRPVDMGWVEGWEEIAALHDRTATVVCQLSNILPHAGRLTVHMVWTVNSGSTLVPGTLWPADLVYCMATNLCTCICKVVEHSPGGPFPHRNPLLHRSNLQALVQFHRQCHVQLPGLLPQNILLDRVRRAAAPGPLPFRPSIQHHELAP